MLVFVFVTAVVFVAGVASGVASDVFKKRR
jgi:hypothetical protein